MFLSRRPSNTVLSQIIIIKYNTWENNKSESLDTRFKTLNNTEHNYFSINNKSTSHHIYQSLKMIVNPATMTEVHAKIVEHFVIYVKISQSPSICHHIQSGRKQMAQVSHHIQSGRRPDWTLYFHSRYVKISQTPKCTQQEHTRISYQSRHIPQKQTETQQHVTPIGQF